MPLTNEQKAKIRRHLGYLNVKPAGAIMLGIPSAAQPQFVLDINMEKILPEAEAIVLADLAQCDAIDAERITARKRYKAVKVGSIELQKDERKMLDADYRYWTRKLADHLGSPLNPFSYDQAGGGINAQVVNT